MKSRTGPSRSEIYRRQGLGLFPQSISLGAWSVGWIEFEIDQWIEARIRGSRGAECEEATGG